MHIWIKVMSHVQKIAQKNPENESRSNCEKWVQGKEDTRAGEDCNLKVTAQKGEGGCDLDATSRQQQQQLMLLNNVVNGEATLGELGEPENFLIICLDRSANLAEYYEQ